MSNKNVNIKFIMTKLNYSISFKICLKEFFLKAIFSIFDIESSNGGESFSDKLTKLFEKQFLNIGSQK